MRRDSYVRAIGCGCLTSAFSVFLHSFVDSNMHIAANALLFSCLLAIGAAAIHSDSGVNGAEAAFFKTSDFILDDKRKKAAAFIASLAVFMYLVINAAFIGAADICASIGKAKKDMEYLNRAIRLAPASAEYRYLYAQIASDNFRVFKSADNKIDNAIIENLKSAVQLNNRYGLYHQKLGLAYLKTGDPVKAAAEIRKAQELDPTAAFNYLLLAVYYFNEATKIEGVDPYGSKAMEEGVAEYRKAISMDPSRAIHRYKGLLPGYQRINRALKRYSL